MEKIVDDKSIVNNVAEEVKVFKESINEIYVQISDVFELQYVIYIMILKFIGKEVSDTYTIYLKDCRES